MVLHAYGARLLVTPEAARDRLRLHGRTLGLQWRVARASRARARVVRARRPRVHRRTEPLRSEARAAHIGSRLPFEHRPRALRAGTHGTRRAGRPARNPEP